MKVIGYMRVSTPEQAMSGQGMAAQERAIRQECDARGHELVRIVRDDGLSAKDMDRPGLNEALGALAMRRADGLVVAKLDRLTRSVVDLNALLEWAASAGLVIVALDLGLDTSTPTGRLVAGIMGQVAQWEREVIADRTREAAMSRRLAGMKMGREGVRDQMPEIADRIARERAQGRSWQQVCDGLNADGVPTVRGGAEWRISAVQAAGGYARPPRKRRQAVLPTVLRAVPARAESA